VSSVFTIVLNELEKMMAEKPPIVFKCEASLWAMMAQVNPYGSSARPFDMRRWDLADERIYRLAWGRIIDSLGVPIGKPVGRREPFLPALKRVLERRSQSWAPDEKEVSFVNKATGELLTFEYLGVEFAPWAPGWGFLILGKRLHPPVKEAP
jgi:hypothetical protein